MKEDCKDPLALESTKVEDNSATAELSGPAIAPPKAKE
jgi:hypothetical protein